MTTTPALAPPLTDAEFDEFEDLLFAPYMPAETLDLETLDGFLCGLICAPCVVMPGEFMPEIFGGALPEWPDATVAQRFIELLMRRWNEIAYGLDAPVDDLNDPRAYSPLLLDPSPEFIAEYEARRNTDDPPLPAPGQAWAEGVLLALEFMADDWEAAWAELGERPDASIDALMLLGDSRRGDDALDDDELGRTLAEAIWAVYDLRDYGRAAQFERERPREPVRAAAVPGRNDACPCGSGKKFKKCCGAPDMLH